VIFQRVIRLKLFLLLFGLPAMAGPTVLIDSCHDGDTCRTSTGEKIRIACIDAAELTGPRATPQRAEAARDYLRQLVVGKEVLIRRIGQDRYGRAIAEIYLWPLNIGEEMVASGHARILRPHARQCPWALL
jgi:micrococcal nuclease